MTGLEKQAEVEAAAQAFGVDAKTAKRLIKHPFYSYPGGHSFFDLYVDVIDGLHRLGHAHPGHVLCLYTHSSTLRALRIYLDPRPFREAFSEFGVGWEYPSMACTVEAPTNLTWKISDRQQSFKCRRLPPTHSGRCPD